MKNKGNIVAFVFITDDNGNNFNVKVQEAIEKYQNLGCFVEVKFAINDKQYGAMVIAREQ